MFSLLQNLRGKYRFQKFIIYTLKKQRRKITQLEKARFIKVNVLKLIQVELLSFYDFHSALKNPANLYFPI